MANTFVGGGDDRLYLRLWNSADPTAPAIDELTVCAERVDGDGDLQVTFSPGGYPGIGYGGYGSPIDPGATPECRRLRPPPGTTLLQLLAEGDSTWAVSVHADP